MPRAYRAMQWAKIIRSTLQTGGSPAHLTYCGGKRKSMRGEPAPCGTQPQYLEGAERAFNMFTKYLIECGDSAVVQNRWLKRLCTISFQSATLFAAQPRSPPPPAIPKRYFSSYSHQACLCEAFKSGLFGCHPIASTHGVVGRWLQAYQNGTC